MSENLNARLDAQDAEITDLKTSIDQVVAELPQLRADLDAATAALNTALASEAAALAENAAFRAALEDAATRVEAGTARLDTIDEALEDLSGENAPPVEPVP